MSTHGNDADVTVTLIPTGMDDGSNQQHATGLNIQAACNRRSYRHLYKQHTTTDSCCHAQHSLSHVTCWPSRSPHGEESTSTPCWPELFSAAPPHVGALRAPPRPLSWTHLLWWYALMAMSPAYSPLAPLLGCRLTASKPVMEHSWADRSLNISA